MEFNQEEVEKILKATIEIVLVGNEYDSKKHDERSNEVSFSPRPNSVEPANTYYTALYCGACACLSADDVCLPQNSW